MKSSLTAFALVRKVSLVALAATLALASVACGAAPDGEPSHDPTSSTAVGDQIDGTDGGATHVSPAPAASASVSAPPAPVDPGASGGGPSHGPPGGGGDGHTPHGERWQ